MLAKGFSDTLRINKPFFDPHSTFSFGNKSPALKKNFRALALAFNK